MSGRHAWLAVATAIGLSLTALPASSVGLLPDAVDDLHTFTDFDTFADTIIDVRANDVDGEGNNFITLDSEQPPTHGDVSVVDGGIHYVWDGELPAPATDTFGYTLTDIDRDTDLATVTVSFDWKPTATDDTRTVQGSPSGFIDAIELTGLLANDREVPGEATFTEMIGPSRVLTPHGAVRCVGGKSCFYEPDAGFHGEDTFEYTVGNRSGQTDQGQVTVNVVATQRTLTLAVNANPRWIWRAGDTFGVGLDFGPHLTFRGCDINAQRMLFQVRRNANSPWRTADAGIWRPGGGFRLIDPDPRVTQQYRVHHPATIWCTAASSAAKTIKVKHRVTGAMSVRSGPVGRAMRINGRVGPVASGQPVLLQRYLPAKRRYVTIASKTLNVNRPAPTPGATYSFSYTPRTRGTHNLLIKAPARAGRYAAMLPFNYRAR